MHCMLAVYRSIFDYFLHRKLSWKEMESFTGYEPGRAAWTVKSLVQMQRMGFDIRMVEPFEYARYEKEGVAYLDELYTREQREWFVEHSNILDIQPYIPEFLAAVAYECRRPTLADIDAMLDERRLVFVTLNSKRLNGQDGYTDHAVLVLYREGDDYVVHDPGHPPQPNRIVPRDRLWHAMGAEQSTSEVTGFKLKDGYDKRGMRLDQYVVRERPSLSRAYAVKLVEAGDVLVNGRQQKPGYKLRETDEVLIAFEESELSQIPAIDLPIVYEDADVLVVNKPTGVISHSRGKYWDEPSVASFVRQHINKDETWDADDQQRAGIVHRLDRATSGIMICAKNARTMKFLQRQFGDRKVKKSYAAIVSGHMEPKEAVIDMPIERNPKEPSKFRVGPNGKSAITTYKVIQSSEHFDELELLPKTGRTHQLRVHLKQVGHPIVGDVLYDGSSAERLCLHAFRLEITLPGGERKLFEAPIPPEFKQLLTNDV